MSYTFGTPGLQVSDEGEGVFSRDVSLVASSAAENDLAELKRAVLEAKYSNLLGQVRILTVDSPDGPRRWGL